MRTFLSKKVDGICILMRHGKATYTKYEDRGLAVVNGSLVEQKKKLIIREAQTVAEYLKSKNIEAITIITSPKLRCLQTAEIIEDYLVKSNIKTTSLVENNLRDVDVIKGSYDRWEKRIKQGENWFDAWVQLQPSAFLEGEESPQMICNRTEKIFGEIVNTHKSALVVCHEEVFFAAATFFGILWQKPDYGESWIIENSQ